MFPPTPARPRGRPYDSEKTATVRTPVADERVSLELAERREAWAGQVGCDQSSDWLLVPNVESPLMIGQARHLLFALQLGLGNTPSCGDDESIPHWPCSSVVPPPCSRLRMIGGWAGSYA